MAKGFKHGGFHPLNFKIVGNPKSANPRENTIWIDTDEKITEWALSETEPVHPSEGMVWIKTGSSYNAQFNALKRNNIQVYPIAAKQYGNGAWIEKKSEIHQGGNWVELIDRFWVIKDGNLQTNVVSGFNVGTGDSGQGSISFANGYIQVSTPNGSYARHTSKETIPTKKYSKLCVEYESTNHSDGNGEQFGVGGDICLISGGNKSRSVQILDISALNQDYTFSLIARAWATGSSTTNRFYNLWLE